MLDRALNHPVCVIASAMALGCGLAFVSIYLLELSIAMNWGGQIANWIADSHVAGSHSDRIALYARTAILYVPDWVSAALGGAILGRAFRRRWLLAASAGGIAFVLTPLVIAWDVSLALLTNWDSEIALHVGLWQLSSLLFSLLLMLLVAFVAASIGSDGHRERSSSG